MTKTSAAPFAMEATVGSKSTDAEVQLEIVPRDAEDGLEDAQEVVTSIFAVAVDLGLFAIEPSGTPASRLQLEQVEPGAARYRGRCEGVDPGAWRLLLACMCTSHYAHAPLERVLLRLDPVVGETLTAKTLFTWPLPRRVGSTPFALEVADTFPGSEEPLIRFEFARKLTDAQVEQLGAAVSIWESLILLGGYNDSCAQRDEAPFSPGELYRASPRIVENTMFSFQARGEAFDPLVNLAVHFHRTVAPLKRLELV
jgi:hypothetical protein